MSANSIPSILEDIEAAIVEAKQKVSDLIVSRRKQNPALKSLRANCFTISVSDLSDDFVLSPRYYDFLWQYDEILRMLHEQSLETFRHSLERIVRTGKTLDGQRFHPQVISDMKELLEEEKKGVKTE